MNAPQTLTAEAGWTHQDLAVTFPSFRDAARVQIFLEGAPVEVEVKVALNSSILTAET